MDKLWEPLSPVVSNTDMPRTEPFPPDASLVFDISFIPNEPEPDVAVLIPGVVPFMCHKAMLCSSGLYKGDLDEYPETTVFYPSNIYETNPLSVIYYLYTGRLTADPSRPNTSFLQQCIELSVTADREHDLDDLQQQVEDRLVQYHPNEVRREMPIKSFVKLVYEYKGGLDSDLRRRLIKPYVTEYIQLLIEQFDQNQVESFPMTSVARLMVDVVSWQDGRTRVDNAIVLLQVLRGFATTISPEAGDVAVGEHRAEDEFGEGSEADRGHGVDEVVEGVNEMTID